MSDDVGKLKGRPTLFTILSLTGVGVGAGNFLWVRRIFARISPNLPENLWTTFCAKIFSNRPFFGMTSKKAALHVILQKLGAIFAQISRYLAKVFTFFVQISTNFAQIFRDFSRIFTRSKLLGVGVHPRLLHHCLVGLLK